MADATAPNVKIKLKEANEKLNFSTTYGIKSG